VWRVAWYRFRVTFATRVGGCVTLAVLVGFLGGLAMASVAAARSTQSSFPAFRAGTNPSDLGVIDLRAATGSSGPSILPTLVGLAHVKRVASWGAPNTLTLGADGTPTGASANAQAHGVFTVVSPNGLFTKQDRATVVQGRMLDPTRADEAVASVIAARVLGLHVGDVTRQGFYTNAQSNSPDFGTAKIRPVFVQAVKVVGIVKFNNEVVQDDIDRLPTFVVLSPALARRLAQCCGAGSTFAGLQLDNGGRDVAAVEQEIAHALPTVAVTSISSVQVAKAERAIEPESIALGVFGVIAALAALLIAGQVIGRQLRLGADDLSVLRSLGAGPALTVVDGLVGIIGAVFVGALLAAGVALALSPLAPLGPVRGLEHSGGIAFDWTVLGIGMLMLIVILSATAFVLAYRGAPHRVARRYRRSRRGGSSLVRVATRSGLSPTAATGIRFAVEPGSGANAVPVRSAIVGGSLAIVVVVATLIFGASLSTLVSRPALYGWNWSYELRSGFSGISNIPEKLATSFLDHDKNIAAWTGVYFATMRVDDLTVPVIGATPHSPIEPSQLSGHGIDAANQIVLAPGTLAQLHKRVGDTVEAGSGTNRKRLVIVGTVALPAVGIATNLHTELATGAVVADALVPTTNRGFGARDGPEAIFVRLRTNVDPAAALLTLKRDAAGMSTGPNDDGPVSVLAVQRPAEIVNYRTMGTAPALLGIGLAVGAASALGLTLIASVRRRRRDLALLKTLGFTRRQLAAVVAWQSTIAVGIGIGIGVPLGIIIGRELWNRFATALHVIPHPTVPSLTITLIAVGALALANLVAAIPGLRAARTPSALLLHEE
jgi:hypothetical protein